MRHFSTITMHSIVTVGQYGMSRKSFLDSIRYDLDNEVLPALAMALEEPQTVLVALIAAIVPQGLLDEDEYVFPNTCSPAVGRVIANLVRFLNVTDWESDKAAFSYCNCNTGAAVSWSYVLV